MVTEMTPPHAHMSLESLVSAGRPPTRTLGLPGVQVPAGTGMHGIGVSTPRAAAVAAATIGLDASWHMPNGATFMIGATSPMLAAGPPASGRPSGITLSADGATPPVHINIPPAQTWSPMSSSSRVRVDALALLERLAQERDRGEHRLGLLAVEPPAGVLAVAPVAIERVVGR